MTIAFIERSAVTQVMAGGSNGAETRRWMEQAQGSATAAALSASTAESVVGPTYTTTAAGLAATAEGGSFAVDAGSGTVTIYRKVTGAAVAQRTLATTAALAAPTGSILSSFIQSGTGARARTVQDELRERVHPFQFDAIGTGMTGDDTAALNAALTRATGGVLYVPYRAAGYRFTSTITPPAGTTIVFEGGANQIVYCDFVGTRFELGQGVEIEGGDYRGLSKAGALFHFAAATGRQRVRDFRANSGWIGEIFLIERSGASQSVFGPGVLSRDDAVANAVPMLPAIRIVDGTAAMDAFPIRFVDMDFEGKPSISFGGCNVVFVDNCYLADIEFTANSRAVQIAPARIGNATAVTLLGANHTLLGDFLPVITIGAGADNNTIIGSFNSGFPIDNSGNSRNCIVHWTGVYTCTLSSGGTAPALGNGTLVATWNRSGSQIAAQIEFTVGSTTTLGTGELRFSLPSPPTPGRVQACGTAVINVAGVIYTAVAQTAGASYVSLLRDTSGAVTYNSPVALAAGTTIRIGLSYSA